MLFSCGLVPGGMAYILQGYFTGTGAIIWLPQCQWSKLEKYILINQIRQLKTFI